MKTLHKTTGTQTAFIITDVEPRYQQAVRDLFYQPTEEGFAKTFPADSPNLERVYQNFERYIEDILLQTAQVRPVPWDKALLGFMEKIAGEKIEWWLAGSAALAVRGLDIVPRDIDLITNGVGAQKLGGLLLDYLVEPVTPASGWISDWFGRAFLHARLEWVGDVNAQADEPMASDFGLVAASRLEVVNWHGQAIRVPPLELQLQVSERRGMMERVTKINHFMRSRV